MSRKIHSSRQKASLKNLGYTGRSLTSTTITGRGVYGTHIFLFLFFVPLVLFIRQHRHDHRNLLVIRILQHFVVLTINPWTLHLVVPAKHLFQKSKLSGNIKTWTLTAKGSLGAPLWNYYFNIIISWTVETQIPLPAPGSHTPAPNILNKLLQLVTKSCFCKHDFIRIKAKT